MSTLFHAHLDGQAGLEPSFENDRFRHAAMSATSRASAEMERPSGRVINFQVIVSSIELIEMTGFHHVEVWGTEIEGTANEWGWLLTRVGFTLMSSWDQGQSWTAGDAYLTLTTSPNMSASTHERRRPRVNHLAFKAGNPTVVDSIMAQAHHTGGVRFITTDTPMQGARSTTLGG